jgi:hypothetical protein
MRPSRPFAPPEIEAPLSSGAEIERAVNTYARLLQISQQLFSYIYLGSSLIYGQKVPGLTEIFSMSTLEGKTVLIFGGSSGIGYAVTEGFLKSLANLVIIASSNVERVNASVKKLEGANLGPGKVRGEVIDAKDQAALKEFVSNIGHMDHVVWTSGDPLSLGFPGVELDVAKSKLLYIHHSNIKSNP